MRYKYCPRCDLLRPRTFMMDDRCDACREDVLTITVPRSAYGWGMYVTALVAGIMLLLYLSYRDLNAGYASFIAGVDETLYILMLFAVILLSFVLSFMDLGRTNRVARRIVEERRGRMKD